MQIINQILEAWFDKILWIIGFTVFFTSLSLITPCNPSLKWWQDKRAVLTDSIYWFIVPIFTRYISLLLVLWVGFMLTGTTDGDKIVTALNGHGMTGSMPLWGQIILLLLLSDIYMYWSHRIFHLDFAWPIHAVHHSPKNLDWFSTKRFHPINEFFSFTLVNAIALYIGFSVESLVILAPLNTFHSALVHANLNWTFGKFQYVLASPVFHRWHHTGVDEGGSKNFAPTFPFLDVIFGTYYMPKDKLPENYGVDDPHFPEDFIGQFYYPFRKRKNGA